MGKFLFFVVASLACFVAVESLICNKCTFGVFGICFNRSNETCAATNASVCYTGKATFPSLTSFSGFNNQGCRDSNADCGTNNGTLLGVNYTTVITCCSTDNCNPVTVSGAPSTKMTFTAAAGVALLASVWGSLL